MELDNILDINPDCDPRTLSGVLTAVGGDRTAQQMVFQHLVYDLSFVFSCSDSEPGRVRYNADDIWLPQVNIALFSATGSVWDVATLLRSLQEFDTPGATLVLDRGFVSVANENLLLESGLQFVLPQRRSEQQKV